MNATMSDFRSIGSGFFELDREINYDIQNGALTKGNSSLAVRVYGWTNSLIGNNQPDQQKVRAHSEVKRAFLSVLSRSEGARNAGKALKKAGLPKGWASNAKPLTSRQISTVLNNAQHYRMGIVSQNEKALTDILPNEKDASQRDLRSAIIKAVRSHADYGRKTLTTDVMKGIRQHATNQVRQNETKQVHARFPGLTNWIKQRQTRQPNAAYPTIRISNLLRKIKKTLPQDMQTVTTGEALQLLGKTSALLSKSAWNQNDLKTLDNELSAHADELHLMQKKIADQLYQLETREIQLNPQQAYVLFRAEKRGENEDAMTEESATLSKHIALTYALYQDQRRQLDLVDAKQTYLEAVRLNSPLSTRAVAHSNVLWAQAGLHLIADICEQVASNQLELNTRKHQNADDALAALVGRWEKIITKKEQAYTDTEDPDVNLSVAALSKKNKSDHPIVTGKQEILATLHSMLSDTGLTDKQINELTNETSLRNAQRQALAASNTWQTLERDMLVVRDGAVQSYKSKITPAQHLNDQFKASYTVDGQISSVTAAETDNANHARNLNVSELFDPQGNRMMAVVGHGVLDMWNITDPNARAAANAAGAKEVLEAALATNPRLLKTINTARQTDDPAPAPRLTHVSVNLISPDNLRSAWPFNALNPNSTEKDYTRAQFAAFKANSGPGQTLQLNSVGPVDIDTITFSFGINDIATSPTLSALMLGVWSNVHVHNTANMVKFIGDLGQGEFGARGTPPGGFIGAVYDKAQAAGQTELLQKLRVQTDTVRELFTSKAFMEGRSDPAKMGREILVLQTLAEQTLDLIGADNMAATMSQSGKRGTGRGGVTDAELKSKLILQDMGGDMAPDTRLIGDDQELYYTVSASSGQLENQRGNTGLGGSKAEYLKERLLDQQARLYLSGVGDFA